MTQSILQTVSQTVLLDSQVFSFRGFVWKKQSHLLNYTFSLKIGKQEEYKIFIKY